MKKNLFSKIFHWIDQRTQLEKILNSIFNKEIPTGSSYMYSIARAVTWLFVIQMVTGIFLAMYYVPSIEDAHYTVEYISKVVLCGSFLRSIHYYSADAVVILCLFHLLQVIVFGSYKIKRELIWLTGLGLLFLVLAFSMTGALLPWDTKAYFTRIVTINIISETPIIGETIKRILLGGATIGTITLSRFFWIHAFFLPLATLLLIGFHIYLFRVAKPAGSFLTSKNENSAEPFYPKQLFKNTFFFFIIFLIIIYLSFYYRAPLGPRVNLGDASYIARPEWYFFWLFQLLKYFRGSYNILGIVIIPGVLIIVLTLLPFIDKRQERNPLKRPIILSGMIIILSGIGILTYLAKREDIRMYSTQLEKQKKDEKIFLDKPFVPKEIDLTNKISTEGNIVILESFKQNCADCHGAQGNGGIGPSLINLSSKPKRTEDNLIELIENPTKYGLSPSMPSFSNLSLEERKKIAHWITSLK